MNNKETEDNNPVVGGLYMWLDKSSSTSFEYAIIVCEILDDEFVLPFSHELTTNGLIKKAEPKKAYRMNVLINMPHLDKVKYQVLTLSHDAWHKYTTRKA